MLQSYIMITIPAKAKINWYLRVLNRRPDGYHNIESIMQRIGLCDDLIIKKASALSLQLIPPMDLPIKENLVYKTALALQGLTGPKAGASITLIKQIPSGAGLGGGSSDAASTLIGLNRLWGLNLSMDKLMPIATTIGSDVPFFLGSPIAKVTGRGETIEALPISVNLPIVIVKPPIGISTKEAYEALNRDNTAIQEGSQINEFIDALCRQDFAEMSRLGVNDFESYAFRRYPLLREIKEGLLSVGALYSMMSGSGSAIFGIFDTYKDAQRAAEHFRGHFVSVTTTI